MTPVAEALVHQEFEHDSDVGDAPDSDMDTDNEDYDRSEVKFNEAELGESDDSSNWEP